MSNLDLTKTTTGTFSSSDSQAYQVPLMTTDGVSGDEETEWFNSRFGIQWGYFSTIPDLKAAILQKANWNTGKGFTTDNQTQAELDTIRGWGKDSFEDILYNMDVISMVSGDSYAEIIRDEKSKRILNIKVLSPDSIKIIVDKYGIIKGYKQINKKTGGKVKEFDINDIWHISNNRLADQIHGISDIDVLEQRIIASEQAFYDSKKYAHNQARPLVIFKLKTDNATVRNTLIAQIEEGMSKGEHLYIPDDENAIVYEVLQVPPNPFLLEFKSDMRNDFFRAINSPQVTHGAGGQSTESESKVIYLAFEQIIEKRQRFLEKSIQIQLGKTINLYPPVTMSTELQQDASKDGNAFFKPSDLVAGQE